MPFIPTQWLKGCEGQPVPRPGYPKPEVYTTFVWDPFGNKLEAIYNGFAV